MKDHYSLAWKQLKLGNYKKEKSEKVHVGAGSQTHDLCSV